MAESHPHQALFDPFSESGGIGHNWNISKHGTVQNVDTKVIEGNGVEYSTPHLTVGFRKFTY